MLISEYGLMPTGAPQPCTITFDIILPDPAYPALTSSGVVDEAASGAESLHRGDESKCEDGGGLWAMQMWK